MKKGFTLIELLAVIVILAIIAVIAVPIVLNIIDETRDNANKRSVDMYAKAVDNAVASYKLNGNSLKGDFATIDGKTVVSKSDSNVKFYVDYTGSKVVCDTFKIYDSGKFYLSDCKVNNTLVNNYSKGEKKEVKLTDICTPNIEQLYATNQLDTGYKYDCKVDPKSEPYKFYVLSYNDANGNIIDTKTNAKSINLIMDRNINSDGTPVTKWIDQEEPENGVYNEVEWINQGDYESAGGQNWDDWTDNHIFGPITAMNYLQEATKSWTNTNELTINKFTECDTGYNGVCIEQPMKEYSINARIPHYNEIDFAGIYKYDNLHCEPYTSQYEPYFCVDGVNHIQQIYYYWTLSYESDSAPSAIRIMFYGGYDMSIDDNQNSGVRPVITLNL